MMKDGLQTSCTFATSTAEGAVGISRGGFAAPPPLRPKNDMGRYLTHKAKGHTTQRTEERLESNAE